MKVWFKYVSSTYFYACIFCNKSSIPHFSENIEKITCWYLLQLAISAIRQSDVPTNPQSKHFPAKQTAMLPADTFNGKVALITGGGTGIGKSITETISKLGGTVVIMSR